MNLENLNIDLTNVKILKANSKGDLINKYSPFKNLVNDIGEIVDFKTNLLDVDLNYPVNIEIQPSFDGSVNLILNNDKEKPKLINSRFSVEEGNTFTIPDHNGNRDSNLYKDLNLDTRLYKTINKIPILKFNGLSDNGKMKCGSYHFYFKLADNDDNETDFISESGLVVCHIGNYNDPSSVRMGLLDENSNKSINFNLSNIDSSYDFIKVYYTRTTSDFTQKDIITAHYISTKYPINSDFINLTITGNESIEDIDVVDINPQYEIIESTKSQIQCQNRLFFGNINKPIIKYKELEEYSLNFCPYIVDNINIGNLDSTYRDVSGKDSYEYYNPNNLYYNLGYWPEEYYRFGIVYILNDYTLSPVFNVRGIDFTTFIDKKPDYTKDVQIDEDGYINKKYFENAKGVVKIYKKNIISSNGVNPIGINFRNENTNKLKELTKGFFIVRQERTPTIIAQGLSIYKTKNDYGNIPIIKKYSGLFVESFLDTNKRLNPRYTDINLENNSEGKAAIIPEAEIRESLFSQLFTSSDYKLDLLNQNNLFLEQDGNNFFLNNINKNWESTWIDTKLTLVSDGISLTTNGIDYFSSMAGNSEQAWNAINVEYPSNQADGSGAKINTKLSDSKDYIRGIFGTYVGLDKSLKFGTLFNIYSSDYSITNEYKNTMFKLRTNISEPYFAISDRITWNNSTLEEITVYRGDCFVCNFTHRMHRNFIDPDLPTNNKIIDSETWLKNFKVYQDSAGINRQLITYKQKGNIIVEPSDASYATRGTGILDAITGVFTNTGEEYKIQGCDKINRADVNAVPLGHWVTFKVLSNINLSMRDIDFNNIDEEAIHRTKRGFFPFYKRNPSSKLADSNIINGASNVTLSKRFNFIIPDVPFIKNKFDTRIIYSDLYSTDNFKNGYRIFSSGNYKDYAKTYGAIIDMKEFYGNLFVTLEHGCLLIPVNERAVAAESKSGMAYINTNTILPDNPRVISDIYGSIWQESIIKTKTGIYGVDTVNKKIWYSNGEKLECISDLKVQKFLNDNINLKESDKLPTIGLRNVKTHYNKNKGDIMFTFYNNEKQWNLCYNENLKKFITRYSWIPSYSSNINGVFFSFNKNDSNQEDSFFVDENGDYIFVDETSTDKILFYENTNNSILWKHGMSGIYDNQGVIKPTTWYGETERFEFEFVVADIPGVQKIFNNLVLISNKTEPESFTYEITGESYDWYEYKKIISWISNKVFEAKGLGFNFNTIENAYKHVLSNTYLYLINTYSDFPKLFNKQDSYKMPKLPFIPRIRYVNPNDNLYWNKKIVDKTNLTLYPLKNKDYELNTTSVKLIQNLLTNEDKINIEQLGNDLKKYGRMRGNMQYLEDAWNIEIKPINFKYAYLNSNGILSFTSGQESKIRDKYIKIRVIYSGNDLAIIQGIKTLFTISYA